ncbi:TPA: PIN/TRAM domain-containing protein [Candidatus Berkelbacteria bacterium]|uniref:Twitching motility protein PilT n=1 Tax=Berkelbacteria bacterium GW2011_GWE1_39_12 TaxID=1618337 RepID=A0A0G4B3C5_9BACT|nr:MAG: twitching motility protein PilT [Berkelbacteria bacterium GW2011_GWE1_39_12]HBO60495.1 PIN/TRAM domain-containing protein [Candidatus Berkelbacteria bacterium]
MFNIPQSQQDLLFFIIILIFSIGVLFITRKLLRVSFPYFFLGILGLIVGLAIGSLAAQTLSKLPGDYGRWLPIIVNVFITVAVLDLFLAQAKSVTLFIHKLLSKIGWEKEDKNLQKEEIMLDTSILIDGRIEEIARAGFILAAMVVPQFILNELQAVADSEDPLKRAKGRKGLEVLDHLQHDQEVDISIIDEMTHGRDAVDSRLIKIAKAHDAKILTVDYNLNRVAKIQNVKVLNINELSEAIKPMLIPGENIVVKVIQEGKESNQGVGYLADGTMIVVEGGDKFIGKEVDTEVVRIFQTVAGKMIFVQPKKPTKGYRTIHK